MSNFNNMVINDTINGTLGEAYIEINEQRKKLFQLKSIELKPTINTYNATFLGDPTEQTKITGISYTGTGIMYYGSPIFQKILENYHKTQIFSPFTLVIKIEDKSSRAGKQIAILRNCMLTETTLIALDTTSQGLESPFTFTCSAPEYDTHFSEIPGV